MDVSGDVSSASYRRSWSWAASRPSMIFVLLLLREKSVDQAEINSPRSQKRNGIKMAGSEPMTDKHGHATMVLSKVRLPIFIRRIAYGRRKQAENSIYL